MASVWLIVKQITLIYLCVRPLINNEGRYVILLLTMLHLKCTAVQCLMLPWSHWTLFSFISCN